MPTGSEWQMAKDWDDYIAKWFVADDYRDDIED